MKTSLLSVQIRHEHDVVLCRQRARQIAEFFGFERQDQVRTATAISELARNIFQYARQGRIDFSYDDSIPALQIVCSDKGPGIADLKTILEGNYVSPTGLGLGLVGAKKLMDKFEPETSAQGTTIRMEKTIPRLPLLGGGKKLDQLMAKLAANHTQDPFSEIQQQNQDLLAAMEELQKRKEELDQLNRELEDTNRGVVALYAELDEKAEYLRRASEVKTRFLSNMTHEFRTPLNSILGLSRLLLDRSDGELNLEQEKQVSFIRRAATDLSELVNDMLDISKVEAGKITVRPSAFELDDLFGALRGMLRPLLTVNSAVTLTFEKPPAELPCLHTDESKLAQILRNFISNALKYTDRGEVVVRARMQNENILISVSDTGIGIAEEDLEKIFEEFTQIEGPHQKKIKGTGLGLSLSRKLAELLGGRVSVESTPGAGSTFTVALPLQKQSQQLPLHITMDLDPGKSPVLLVDDNRETLHIYEKYLKDSPYQGLPARSIAEARQILEKITPAAIVLDVLLERESSWNFISELKSNKQTCQVPLLVVTVVENESKARTLGADAFHLKPMDPVWLLQKLKDCGQSGEEIRILIVDDDQVSRYLFRGLLNETPYQVVEAAGGHDGLRLARTEKPAVIFLDMAMPDLDGFEFVKRSSQDEVLKNIPVVIYSTKTLTEQELRRFHAPVAGSLTKDHSSREKSRPKILNMISKILGSTKETSP